MARSGLSAGIKSPMSRMPAKVPLKVDALTNYYESTKRTHNTSGAHAFLLNTTGSDKEIIEAIRYGVRRQLAAHPNFDWGHDVKKMPLDVQKQFWSFRQWLFTQILILVAKSEDLIESVKGDCVFMMFGSDKPTSDIDVSVDARQASEIIKFIETVWMGILDTEPQMWDVEFYGDFLMFLDDTGNKAFLNSRGFKTTSEQEQILPFVGVSILRNAGNLEFKALNTFLEQYPELGGSSAPWKEKAKEIFASYQAMSPDERRAEYYRLLGAAEHMRDDPNLVIGEKVLKVFLALCEANIYRNENYILPSTVIHVVRDIQAKSPRPTKYAMECPVFRARLASCALGRFTYLCSALEQLGYMERFAGDAAKQEKYGGRFEDALARIQLGGRRTARRRGASKRKGRTGRKKTARRSRPRKH